MIGPIQGPSPRPSTAPINTSPSSSSTHQEMQSKTTVDIITSRNFWKAVYPRTAAGGVLGLVLGSGFGITAGFESIKLENPVARAAIKAALKAGKTPGEAVDAASVRGESVIPSLENLVKHRVVLTKTVLRTAGAFSVFLGSYWGVTTGTSIPSLFYFYLYFFFLF